MAGAGGSGGAKVVLKPLVEGPRHLCSVGRAEVRAAAALPSLLGLLHRQRSCRDSPASLGHRLPVRVSAVPDL